ncbi:hydroxyacid dehydrogenase [Streptomyces sp. 110]|uniref:Hydroxyacid dehydrogenase n=2 Tax=Streptomyces endocoffeicus TaxID=2898945 RepID=A0ABS1Q1Z6_9ACTN|nr:hydroxyacid dehydrogenase [Streptomyces endocoffeicus]
MHKPPAHGPVADEPRGCRPETLLAMGRDSLRLQFGEPELVRLRAAATVAEPLVTDELTSQGVRSRLAKVEVLITSWGCPPLDADVLSAAPRLRAVFHAAGSVRGHIDERVLDRGIVVTTAADANAEPVARYTLAAVLWSFKKVPFLAQDARKYREDVTYRDRRGELSGRDRTVVIVGFSRIGRRVAALLRTLHEGPTLVVDPFADPAEVHAAGAELLDMAEALPRADVLSLHAPLLPETRHMIGAAELARLRPGATLVNTARGALVDTTALEHACASGRLDAILDVTDPEPLPAGSPLYDLPNVLLTPHIAGSQGTETHTMAHAALTELERYAAGLPPLHPVTRESLAVQA